MKTRVAAAVLAAVMLMLACALSFAEGFVFHAGTDAPGDTFFNDGMVCGNSIYVLGEKKMHVYTDGEWKSYEYDKTDADGREIFITSLMKWDDVPCVFYYVVSDDSDMTVSLRIGSLTFDDDKAAVNQSAELISPELMSDIVSYYDSIGGLKDVSVYVDDVNAVGSKLYIHYMGSDFINHSLYAYDTETDNAEAIEDGENIITVTPYGSGKLLLQLLDEDTGTVTLKVLDCETDETEQLGTPFVAEGGLQGLVGDPDTNTIYYIDGNYILSAKPDSVDAPEGKIPLTINDTFSVHKAELMNGNTYVVFAFDTVSGIDLKNSDTPENILTVKDYDFNTAADTAAERFNSSHSDAIALVSRDFATSSELLDMYMKKESTPDVLLLPIAGEEYRTLLERGYLQEITDDPVLKFVEKIYPAFKQPVTRDGAVVAAPISVRPDYTALTVNTNALKKLGMTVDDLPDTWPEFLDFLNSVSDKVNELDDGTSLFDRLSTAGDDMKASLLEMALASYERYLDITGKTEYNTPELRDIINRILNIDTEALGISEEVDLNDSYAVNELVLNMLDTGKNILNLYGGTTLGSISSDSVPILIKIGEEAFNPLHVDMCVAVINPYSKHPELAQEFVGLLVQNLHDTDYYNFSDENNEPLINESAEQQIKEEEESVEKLKKKIETAEAIEKEALQDALAAQEAMLEYYKKENYTIGRSALDWYRAHASQLYVNRFSRILSDDFAEERDKLLSGQLSVDEFLAQVDQKIAMMNSEGN